jgi:hopene-associated glycosyltransferase HpnB
MRPVHLVAWVPLGIWAYLAAGRGRFWTTKIRLPEAVEPSEWPAVTVVVPARDEAAVLGDTLPAILGQLYPGVAEVIVVDDRSSDGTGDVARQLGSSQLGGLPLRVLEGKERPAGWAGKVWAMAQGLELATGEWVLFTDADIWHPPTSLRHLTSHALEDERDAVSLMARLSTTTTWERLIAPAFVYFFAQLYPFRMVNDVRSRTAAAAGGCLLVRAAALRQAGGLAAMAGSSIDDVALSKLLARSGHRLWLGLADDVRSLRPYPRFSDLWNMVTRNAYTQLRTNPALLAATVGGLSVTYLAPPTLALSGLWRRRPARAVAGLAAWTLMTLTYLPMTRYYRVSPWTAVALPFTASLYLAMTLDSARRHRAGGLAWKARTLRHPSP